MEPIILYHDAILSIEFELKWIPFSYLHKPTYYWSNENFLFNRSRSKIDKTEENTILSLINE